MSVVNLKELIENYARQFFKENERDYYKKLGKSVGWKELSKEINWKNLRCKHENVVYQDLDYPGNPGKIKSNVLFRSTFINDTTKEQEYLLRTERKTTSSCDIELYEGYVTEGSLELSLEIPLPGCVLSSGAGFKRQYSLENSTVKSFQEEVSWSIESNVKVPGMSKTTAELLVQEDEYKGQFEIKTYFTGGVSIRLYKDNMELVTIDLDDLSEIFTVDRGFKRDKRGIFRITKGECKARFGIEQKIELHQRPLTNLNHQI